MFDVYYMGENPGLKENLPFARQISDIKEANPQTKMYWVIEPNIELLDYDVLEYRPPDYDQKYVHIWKWNSRNYGGIKLIPKTKSDGIKEVNKVVCKKHFDILRQKQPGKYFEKNPYATHVWCVDPGYKLAGNIEWAPDNYEPNFIHSFHLRGQLEDKYPKEEGGVKLFPRGWKDAEIKYHKYLDAAARYPVMFVKDPEDYAQRDTFKEEYVWLVDAEHRVNLDTFDWVPNPFEEEFIHSFRMPYQLTEKTWSYQHSESNNELGGIRLVPKDWRQAYKRIENGVVIHKDCPIEDENYDVFYTNKAFDAECFEYYAKRTETDWFWVIDRDYDFNGKLLFVPASHECDYIHVFKWGLEHRYPAEVTELWDDRVAGIYLVHKDFDITKQKLHTDIVPVRYDIYFTEDMNDYERFSRRSRTDAFWLVDNEHVITEVFKWVPPESEQRYINIFKLPEQLEHKYPSDITNVSDNRCGGIKLVPKNYITEDIKYQGYLSDVEHVEFEVFKSEEEGRAKSTWPWFWVVDPNVLVLEDFTFNFIPGTWDEGKTHMWQKLNPKTGRQFDYGGVMLCHKKPVKKGRPKYIMEPACTAVEFPVLELTTERDIIAQLEQFDDDCTNTMYWVIDPFTRLSEDFDFDYYPTKWDEQNVHVFLSGGASSDEYKNVRLYPKGTFAKGHKHTESSILNNTFQKLKKMNTVASLPPQWPDVTLVDMTRDELRHHLKVQKEAGTPFFWTIDADVDPDMELIRNGFLPTTQNVGKVHLWQRINPHNGKVTSYGGLRLWPTDIDPDIITTDAVLLNKMKGVQYVRQPGCYYKPFDIVFLSYNEPNAADNFKLLQERYEKAHWVKDVEGIFNAHKAAAEKATTKMFWVVDADAEIVPEFDFSYIPDQYDQDVVHVWNSKNPVTDLEYGYGGVKLFNREQILDANNWGLDFTTGLSKRFKAMPELSCITRFNTDEYSTWRSAFRECVKLAQKRDAESKDRLEAWLHPAPGAKFRDEAKAGAIQGKEYGEKYGNKPLRLAKINDYEWLEEQWQNAKET